MPVMLAAADTLPSRTDELVPWSWAPIVVVVGAALFIAGLAALAAWRMHRWLVIETPLVPATAPAPKPVPAATAEPDVAPDGPQINEPMLRRRLPAREVAADHAA